MKVNDLLMVIPGRQNVAVLIGYDTSNCDSISGQAGTLYKFLAESVTKAEVGNVLARGDVLTVWVDEEGVD